MAHSLAPVEPGSTHPTPTPEQRIAVVRSLLGHRNPSEHLCRLISMACDGATWSEIHAVDAAVRA